MLHPVIRSADVPHSATFAKYAAAFLEFRSQFARATTRRADQQVPSARRSRRVQCLYPAGALRAQLDPIEQRLLGHVEAARSLGHAHRFVFELGRVFRPDQLLQHVFLFSVERDLVMRYAC